MLIPPSPSLLTFDIFGTVLDWRTGLTASLKAHGVGLGAKDFDRVIDHQAELEQSAYDTYESITARSLVEVLGVPPDVASAIGAAAGTWPLFADSAPALERLIAFVPCAAMTNSDIAHGIDVQQTLGFPLTHWLCAEHVRLYKPTPLFWNAVGDRTGHAFDPTWWHVSAYADYDLRPASALGLTTIFIERPHSRPGPATLTFPTLTALAGHIDATYTYRP